MYTYKNIYIYSCVRMSGQFVLKIDRMERNFMKEKKLYFIRYNTTKRMWNGFHFLKFDTLSYFSLHEELFGCQRTLYNEFWLPIWWMWKMWMVKIEFQDKIKSHCKREKWISQEANHYCFRCNESIMITNCFILICIEYFRNFAQVW